MKKMKYNNQRVANDFHSFSSKLEKALYDFLVLREKNGEITELKCQVSVHLTDAEILYKPDFSFFENGKLRFCEAKGFETSDWRIKRRLWEYYGPAPLEIYKGSANNFVLHEIIVPK
jgi:uncharacterized protein DUF1064